METNQNYTDPVSYYFDGVKISKNDAINKMAAAGVSRFVRRYTMWELLQVRAALGNAKAIELMRHLTRQENH